MEITRGPSVNMINTLTDASYPYLFKCGMRIKRKGAKRQGRNLRLVRQTPTHQSGTSSVEEYFVCALRLCALASLR
jgi:hypothetical protein